MNEIKQTSKLEKPFFYDNEKYEQHPSEKDKKLQLRDHVKNSCAILKNLK